MRGNWVIQKVRWKRDGRKDGKGQTTGEKELGEEAIDTVGGDERKCNLGKR